MNDFARMMRMAKVYKEAYPAGTRICLINMDDPYSPVPAGTKGTVVQVDDMGQLHMKWDNGRTLALVPQVDSFRKLTPQELAEERGKKASLDEQIHSASSGRVQNESAHPPKKHQHEI